MSSEEVVVEEPVLSEDLKRLLTRKQELESELVNVERRIYRLEENYLQDTAALGNIVKGWAGYLSSRSLDQIKQVTRKVKDSERLFTFSSTSGLANNSAEPDDYDDEPRRKRRKHKRKSAANGDWN
ncbi:uncharacterized protein AMSG_03879 [Thecamonas trahens ATCC 50062]|uniref:Chromatin modification-related protein MEAF6 n=1 Tax=Thecamonas trahens ATCC 50062 TaxID=461836 RepID=A0A0L0D5M9_THETB|nr:hypothetical protein AMSG_03879 [Thecamonas trahens ATCC 50062]KNC47649.1 hypothetical protein AMSG_03879 [Thecamonas trahens ATCC 50062]|eukprot:XP_013759133.1 hypothetical protein AMSG_03879 [Thecamonas trahens ATCC 50062]